MFIKKNEIIIRELPKFKKLLQQEHKLIKLYKSLKFKPINQQSNSSLMQSDNNLPYQSQNNDSKKLSYPTLAQFIKKTRQLLKEQQKYEIDMFNEMTQDKPMQQIEEQGYGLSNMLIVGEREGFYGKRILTLIKAYHSEKNPIVIPEECKLQVGDDVAIMKNNSVLTSGVVYKRTGPKIKISIRQNDRQQHYDYQGTNCHLVLKWNEVTFRRYFSILQDLEEYTVFKRSQLIDKLFPAAYDLGQKQRVNDKSVQKQQLTMPNMNSEQVKAIKLGLKHQVHLIHGPPGTGKTTTVCELIVQAVKKGEKVLACAPSNIAVDNIVESIGKKVKCVRIGNPARMINSIIEHCLDSLITQQTSLWKTEVKKLQATRKRLSKCTTRQQKKKLYFQIKHFQNQIHLLQQQVIEQILNEADVICSTNAGAADRVFKKYLSKRRFDLVVIDECGQGLQVSCWIPLLKGKRAVLAGDHKQLPPTVKGMQNTLLSYTLFSRAMDELTNVTSTMLLVQYRMNKLIMGWSNQQFYNNQLVAHQSVKDHLLKQLYQNVEENEEVVMMVDTAGCKMGESGDVNESKMNVGEADIAVSIYRKILRYGVQAKHVVIITPYSKQVSLLKSLINEQNLPLVDISTVDGIQGREKQCVIISLVRSNKKKQIGFLKDWRRMNVAVTRARRMLVIIGNTECVSKDPYIGTLVKWVEENGKMLSGVQFKCDPLVRFGEGVADEEDYDNGNKEKEAKNKNKNKKKKKGEQQEAMTIQKPSIYEAHTEQQIHSLKQYYKKVFEEIKDQVVFPGATNFQRKLIHQVAQQMSLNHQTSQDKKQIKVWRRQPEIVQIQLPEQDRMIQIPRKNRNKLYTEKEQLENQKLLQQTLQQPKIKNLTGSKFGNALQSLIGAEESSQEDEKKEQETKVELITEEKIQQQPKKPKKKNKKPKPQPKQPTQQQTKQQQQDYQKFFSQFQTNKPKKDECYKCTKRITSITAVTCRFCQISFCRNHVLAEEHGCDETARGQAKSNNRELDRLVQKGAEKIKQKIKEQEEARKRKPKEDKNKKN